MMVLTALLATDVFAAKPSSESDVTVTGVLPETAEQGAFKRVRISGTNFEPGSQVKFFISETKDSSQIVVIGEAMYVDEEHLDVDIEVALLAPAVGYDIEKAV